VLAAGRPHRQHRRRP